MSSRPLVRWAVEGAWVCKKCEATGEWKWDPEAAAEAQTPAPVPVPVAVPVPVFVAVPVPNVNVTPATVDVDGGWLAFGTVVVTVVVALFPAAGWASEDGDAANSADATEHGEPLAPFCPPGLSFGALEPIVAPKRLLPSPTPFAPTFPDALSW
eukprot:TRINITY_DN111797_c0_g1_i1.p2 TRINITY_DN111797_c0_g1~~TRINITY_DN111797_c0_g1_i1.p2  ORF type:complete len:154 (-),score=7.12 TRINITY_DN111797_c0_g1_i1:35-496(-)